MKHLLKKYKNIILLFSFGVFPNISKAAVEYTNPIMATSFTELLDDISNFLLLSIAPPIVTIMVLWAAFLYMTSGGEQKKLDQAKAILKWVVIGIVLLLLSKGIAYTIQISLEL